MSRRFAGVLKGAGGLDMAAPTFSGQTPLEMCRGGDPPPALQLRATRSASPLSCTHQRTLKEDFCFLVDAVFFPPNPPGGEALREGGC